MPKSNTKNKKSGSRHGKHYKIYYTPKLINELKKNSFTYFPTAITVPSFGFPVRQIGTEYLHSKKKGTIVVTNMDNKILFTAKLDPSRTKKNKSRSKSRSRGRSMTRRSPKRGIKKSKSRKSNKRRSNK